MAEGGYESGSGSESGDPDKLQRIKDARNVRELFRGCLTDEECFQLLRRHEWDRGKTVEFILKAAPGELLQRLNVDSDTETMAEGGYESGSGSESGDPDKLQRIKDALNVRELFRGRLTDEECFQLLRRHEWDRGKTVEFILKAAPGELLQCLNVDSDTEELAARNEIANSTRQYGCLDCDQMWWRRVPNRKPVSRCFKCKRKFDPIPQEREYGTVEFLCKCGSTFTWSWRVG